MAEKRRITSKDLWEFKFVGDPQLSPDASQVVFTLTTIDSEKNGYRTALALVSTDGKRTMRQITNHDIPDKLVRDISPRWSPDGTKIAFLSNRLGKNQIWILPVEGGEPYRLTNMDDAVSEPAWSPDGKNIVFVSREPKTEKKRNADVTHITKLRYKLNGVGFTDERPRHLFRVELDTRAITQLTSGEFDESTPVWAPDGAHIAFISAREPDRELRYHPDVWVLDLATSEQRRLTRALGPSSSPVWSPCGKKIAYLGTERGEMSAFNTEVFVVSMDGEPVSLTRDFDRSVGSGVGSDSRYDGAMMAPAWSKDGRTVYFLAADRGQSKLFAADASGGDVTAVVDVPGLNVNSFDARSSCCGSTVFAYNAGTQLNPGDIYAGENPVRLTWVNEPLLQTLDIVPHECFTYESDPGCEIEGWLMKPAGFEDDKKYPVVVQIHGGPASTVGEAFSHEYQLMASRGYGVFYMNFRGSKGYGEQFAYAIIGDWGGCEFRDIMAGVDYVEKLDWVDPSRIYVTGGSFGGYETNWIVTKTHRFRAAVTQRSISNMYTKYGVSDIGWYGNKAGMGGADLWDAEEFIMSRSPIRYAPLVRTPILIIHSEQDLRCPMEQAEQWYTALKRLGKVDVEFVRFAGENHELSRSGKPLNRIDRLEHIIGWFDRYNS